MREKFGYKSGDPAPGPADLDIRAQGQQSRRRLLTGVAGGGVLLAVQSRTALGASACQSPSAMLSGNTSPRPDEVQCSGGVSPGIWVQPQKSGYWQLAGATFPTFTGDVVPCSPGLGGLDLDKIVDPGTRIESVLDGGSLNFTAKVGELSDPGIWAVMFKKDRFAQGQLMRHLIAAWLNAGYFSDTYPITQAQVTDMWLSVRYGGTYCPPNITCSNGSGLTADDIIAYIDGMYHINQDDDMPNLCVED